MKAQHSIRTVRKLKYICGLSLGLALPIALSTVAEAHHGFGLFDLTKEVEYTGTITKIDFVNPHSYLYFDRVNENGKTISMKCEMRAAMLLRRSGWSKDMFEAGLPVTVEGNPHRNDEGACYTENLTIGDRPTINRNDQFTIENAVDNSNRPLTLTSGEPNISGSWAVEQLVLTIPPSGGNGTMVPKSMREAYASGAMSIEEIRAGNTPNTRPQYTALGTESAEAFRMWSPEDNPRLSCKPTSIVYDWTFDWPVNRITQTTTASGEKVIDMDYGLYSFTRRIHMDMENHPAGIAPSNTGHSIGHWEGNTLVVDTVSIEAGVLAPPTRNSDQIHVVERYTMDPETLVLTREYTVTDPVYLAVAWQGQDKVLLSDVAFERQVCAELTPEFEQ